MNLARLSSISVVAAFVTATGLGLLWAPPSYAQKALNVTSYGGATIDTWRRLYFEPFEKATGISIRAETWNSNLTLVETMVKSGNVTWDVLDVGGNVVDTTCDQGLIEPFDVSRIGGKDRFFEGMVHKCGIVCWTWNVSPANEAFGRGPTLRSSSCSWPTVSRETKSMKSWRRMRGWSAYSGCWTGSRTTSCGSIRSRRLCRCCWTTKSS